MSGAKKCDRCGKYYQPSAKTRFIRVLYDNGNMTNRGGDMCEKCVSKFEKWWNKGKKISGDAE